MKILSSQKVYDKWYREHDTEILNCVSGSLKIRLLWCWRCMLVQISIIWVVDVIRGIPWSKTHGGSDVIGARRKLHLLWVFLHHDSIQTLILRLLDVGKLRLGRSSHHIIRRLLELRLCCWWMTGAWINSLIIWSSWEHFGCSRSWKLIKALLWCCNKLIKSRSLKKSKTLTIFNLFKWSNRINCRL